MYENVMRTNKNNDNSLRVGLPWMGVTYRVGCKAVSADEDD